MILKRWQEKNIEYLRQKRRIVQITGARQCGKTTVAKNISARYNCIYHTMDNSTSLAACNADTKYFLTHNKDIMIIDEVQKAPVIITALKEIVDEDNRMGRYIITGSANIQALPQAQDSMAGRIGPVLLRTFSQGEILGKEPIFIENLKNLNFKQNYEYNGKEEILDIALKGGYPETLGYNIRDIKNWCKDYIDAILKKDLMDVEKIRNHQDMKKLVETTAAWSSKYMEQNAIGSALSIEKPTFTKYLTLLDTMYIIEQLPAFTKTDYERVTKKPKLFMTDTALITTVLNYTMDKVRYEHDITGKLVETFVYHELAANVDYYNGEYSLYHFRDNAGHEIDFILQDNENNNLYAIEVKAGSNIGKDDFKHIKWFKDNIAKNCEFKGIILYTGKNTLSFGENMQAVPMCALWE